MKAPFDIYAVAEIFTKNFLARPTINYKIIDDLPSSFGYVIERDGAIAALEILPNFQDTEEPRREPLHPKIAKGKQLVKALKEKYPDKDVQWDVITINFGNANKALIYYIKDIELDKEEKSENLKPLDREDLKEELKPTAYWWVGQNTHRDLDLELYKQPHKPAHNGSMYDIDETQLLGALRIHQEPDRTWQLYKSNYESGINENSSLFEKVPNTYKTLEEARNGAESALRFYFGTKIPVEFKDFDKAEDVRQRGIYQSGENLKYQYMLLSRLQMDCDYYLGNGDGYEPHLWASSVEDQIAKMRELHGMITSASPELEPEWLTKAQIDSYEKKMLDVKAQKAEKPVDPGDLKEQGEKVNGTDMQQPEKIDLQHSEEK